MGDICTQWDTLAIGHQIDLSMNTIGIIIAVTSNEESSVLLYSQGDYVNKLILSVIGIFLCCVSFTLQQHEITVRNVEVPLRVYDGDVFIDDLTIEDIELYEDGKPQKILALYLTKNAQIKRQQLERDFMPFLSRSFYFVFQLLDYNPKIRDALDYFFTHIYLPGDYVSIMTILKKYHLSPEALKSNPKETVVDYIQNVIRKDTQIVAKEYNQLMRELKNLTLAISRTRNNWAGGDVDIQVGLESNLTRYRETLQKMDDFRILDEKKFLQFASQIKKLRSQKYVFFFYQREYRPFLNATSNDPNLNSKLQDLFLFYNKETKLNTERISQAFADSSLLFNFIYMDYNPPRLSGIVMREMAGNVKDIFSDIAYATGGISDDSPNPTAAFQKTSDVTRNSYILYYSPRKYVGDGKFRKIEIKVKNKKYKILHRQGYFAD